MNTLLRKCWWEPDKKISEEEDERLRASSLISETAEIEQYQRSWHELNLWNATLYSNRELVGFNWGAIGDSSKELWPTNLHTENLIEEIGDAMLSKASSSPLRPALVPHGGSWKTERAVRTLDNFVFAVWRQTESEDACVRAFLDGFLSGIAAVKDEYDEATDTLSTTPVFFDNIIVDNRECLNRRPPRTVRIREVHPRAAIEAKWGCVLGDRPKYVDYRRVGDGYEVVVEVWRLPDAEGKGGRHVIASCGVLLVDEPWEHDWFPLEFFHYREKLSGFFCPSGVESLVPYQVRLNDLNQAISESQDIRCRPRILKHANSQLDLSQWDNVAGRVLDYAGVEPKPFVWDTELAELYQERERVWNKAFSHAGISEWFAHADAPSNVRYDSSAAVREGRNLEDSRHMRLWTRFQDFRLRVAKMHLRVLAMHESAEAYTAVYHPARMGAAAKAIPFAAVKTLLDDNYTWSFEAVPLSQQSPAARRETLRDWVSRGLMDDAQAKRMLTNPNIELEEDLEMASFEDVYRHIEVMEEGGYEAPTELTNLNYGVKKVTANLHRLKRFQEVDDKSAKELRDVIEKHVQWIVHAVSITQMATMGSTPAPFAPTQGVPGTQAAQGTPPM